MFSLIIPVYRNEGSIAELIETLENLNRQMRGDLEAVLVVDGSPDRSLELLARSLPHAGFISPPIALNRNLRAFPAITPGLTKARGELLPAIAAPPHQP